MRYMRGGVDPSDPLSVCMSDFWLLKLQIFRSRCGNPLLILSITHLFPWNNDKDTLPKKIQVMLGRTKSQSGDEELLLALTPTHTHTHRVSVLLIHSLNGNALYFLAALRGTKWRVWTPAVSQHTVSKSSEPFQKTNCSSEVMFRDVCHPAPPVIVSMEESGARWARIIRWHCTFLQTADMLNVTDHMNRININM